MNERPRSSAPSSERGQSEVPVVGTGESPVGGLCSSVGRQLCEVLHCASPPHPLPLSSLSVAQKRSFALQQLMQRSNLHIATFNFQKLVLYLMEVL